MFSLRHSFPGSRITRTFPFRLITAFPARAASTVRQRTSPTRIYLRSPGLEHTRDLERLQLLM